MTGIKVHRNMMMHLTGRAADLIMPRMEEEMKMCSDLGWPSGPRGGACGREASCLARVPSMRRRAWPPTRLFWLLYLVATF